MEHFDSIEPLIARLKADLPTNPLGTQEGRDEYEWVDGGDIDGGRIMPAWNSPFISPYLYRGQTARYSPCFPALYRPYLEFPHAKRPSQLPENMRDAYLLAQVRFMEFVSVLEQHPAMAHAREIGLHVNRAALAQHYGIPTDMIDLTQDHEVALFFASCKPDASGEWHPVSDGTGVLYRFDITAFAQVLGDHTTNGLLRVLEIVGLQTLPRPGEQKAWTFKLPLGFDFEKLPLDGFTFRHVAAAAEPLARKFEYGRVLFPPDILADVSEQIRSAKDVPRTLVERVLLEHDCNPHMIQEAVQTYSKRFADEFGIAISDRHAIVLMDKQRKAADALVMAKKDDFLKQVGVRGVILGKGKRDSGTT